VITGQGKGLTFAQSHENDHPNDSQIEGDFEFQRDEIERRLGHGRSLQDTRAEKAINGRKMLRYANVAGPRRAAGRLMGARTDKTRTNKMLNSLEIVWNGILQAVRVVGGRTAFADQIGTARPLVRVLLGDE